MISVGNKLVMGKTSTAPSYADGQVQVAAVYNGYIYVSYDYGATWNQKESQREWIKVALSGNGQYINAVYNGGMIVSTDWGENWASKNTGAATYANIVVSATGQNQAMVDPDGTIYTSSDYGTTWSGSSMGISNITYLKGSSASPLVLVGISSANAQIYLFESYNPFNIDVATGRLGITGNGTKFFFSSDTLYVYYIGAYYYEQVDVPYFNVEDIAMSYTGQYVTIAGYGSWLLRSNTSGYNWEEVGGGRNWIRISMNSSGQYQSAIVQNGKIYTSSNYGANWTERDSDRGWSCIEVSKAVV